MKKIFAAVMLALTLAACGGGGDTAVTVNEAAQPADTTVIVETKPMLIEKPLEGYAPDGTLRPVEEAPAEGNPDPVANPPVEVAPEPACHASERGQERGKPAKC